MPTFFEDRHYEKEGNRISSDVVRYHQPGTVSGWIDVNGQRLTVEPDEWYAFRDHSWGIRQQVGQRPADLGPGRPMRRFHMQWSPMLMTRPDGSHYELQYYLIEVDGELRHFTGHVNQPDGSQERVVAAAPQMHYDPRTRGLVGGRTVLTTAGGEQRTIEIEPISSTGFHLHPALYGPWNGAYHGSWRGPLHIDGERIDDCDDHFDVSTNPIWQLRDRCVRVREGDNTGFGVLEHICHGDYPEFGLPAS
jgi:hypothetical protein